MAALALLAGCAVEPPIPLEEDPRYGEVALPQGRAIRLRLTIAPPTGAAFAQDSPRWRQWVALPPPAEGESDASESDWLVPLDDESGEPSAGGLDPLAGPAPPSDPEPPVRASPSPVDPSPPPAGLADREYSWRPPPPDAAKLQRRLARVLSWSLAGGDPVGQIPADWVRGDPERALRFGAEAQGADLLVHLELLDHQVAWVERDTLWWWHNVFMLYGLGIYPIVLVPDEIYEASLDVRVTVVHSRSGRALLSKELVATHRQSLNDPERGWSISGLLCLVPWTLDEGDYQTVWEGLLPHALKELELGVSQWLREALPAKLAEPAVRDLVELGDPAQARTYAVVVGARGPETNEIDRPQPLRTAKADAHAVQESLLDTRTVARTQDVRLLTGDMATAERLLAAITDVGSRMLGHDRLIVYYSGYGRTSNTGPSLMLYGEPLTLRRLSEHCESSLNSRSSVAFLLDTSFGGSGGKTYPGGVAQGEPRAYLSSLWLRHPRWKVLAASGPGEAALALQDESQSLFTTWLLSGINDGADSDEDGGITTLELSTFLRGRVSADARERAQGRQSPALLGTGPEFPVFRKLSPYVAESAPEPWENDTPEEEVVPPEEEVVPPESEVPSPERKHRRRFRLH